MCLRFLLESSPDNQTLLEMLDTKKILPEEILRSQAYVTFIDDDGKVGLRRKPTPHMDPHWQMKCERGIARADVLVTDPKGKGLELHTWDEWEQYTDELGKMKMRKKPEIETTESDERIDTDEFVADSWLHARMVVEEQTSDHEEPVRVDTLRYTLQQHGVEFEPVRF